jgi:hypothetical protein
MLKLTINDPVEVAGPLRQEYKKSADGKYHLEVEAHPDSARLSEFRDRNIALLKEVEELRPFRAKYDGIDPDAAKKALAKAAELEARLAAFDGVDADEYRVLKARPDAAKLEAELAAERAAHQQTQFRNTITTEFLRAGGRESAVDYMVLNAAKVFAADGTTQEFSKANPGVPISVAEWIQEQAKVADFAFKPSRGGSAPPRRSTLGSYRQQGELRDPTPQELGKHASDIASGRLKVIYS